LANVKAYYDELSDVAKPRLIQFAINAKILGSAKTKLGAGTGIATFAQLKAALYEKCGSRETYESLREKLAAIRLRDRTLEAMADEISEIVERLTAIEVQRQGAASEETLRKLVLRDGLLAFKKKVPERLKLVVEAARPETMEEALAVASAASAGADKEEIALLWGEPSSTRSQRDKTKVKCYNCGK
jgi:hypothetical protein